MAIHQGLWVADFATPLGGGHGVVALRDGVALGGDSIMAYAGSYKEEGDTLSVNLHISKHSDVPGMGSVFGIDDFHLHLEGTVHGATATLEGTSPQVPGVKIAVKLRRH